MDERKLAAQKLEEKLGLLNYALSKIEAMSMFKVGHLSM